MKQLRTRRLPRYVYSLAGAVLLIGTWWFIAATQFSKTGSVPTPGAVLVEFISDLGDPTYWNAIGVTLAEAGEGYLWGIGLALALAAVVVIAPWLEGVTTQVAVIASCVPLTALAPLIVLMSSSSSRAASVWLAALGVFFTTVVGALVGLRSAHQASLDVIDVYGGSRWTQLAKVRAITALPDLMGALRIAAPAAFVGAILGEFFLSGVDSGLGIMLMAAQIHYGPLPLWALALICAAVAGLAYAILSWAAQAVTRWATGTQARSRES